ncbi:Tub family [Musa troglodytarum]|uniref:Tub family n=1 Tax=Musa troglodytarum TaxID=320322 RepID=A0A9E7IG32_9LILI|nr:Tub family [Musa troglodytarum]
MYMDAPSFSPAKVMMLVAWSLPASRVCLIFSFRTSSSLLSFWKSSPPRVGEARGISATDVACLFPPRPSGSLVDVSSFVLFSDSSLEVWRVLQYLFSRRLFLVFLVLVRCVSELRPEKVGIPGAAGVVTLVVIFVFLEFGIPGAVGAATLVVIPVFLEDETLEAGLLADEPELGLRKVEIPGAEFLADVLGTLVVVLIVLEIGLGKKRIPGVGFLVDDSGTLVVARMFLEFGLGEDGIPGAVGFLADDSGALVPWWSFQAFRFARLTMGFEKLPELMPVAVARELLSMGWKAERVSSEKKSLGVVVLLEVPHRISSMLTATVTATATRNRKANVK